MKTLSIFLKPHSPIQNLPPTSDMDPFTVQSLVAQQVADQSQEYDTCQQEGSEQENGNIGGNDRGNPSLNPYRDFLKCEPKSYHGLGGAIELTGWIDNIESAFQASHCAEDNKVGIATSTFMGPALSWWTNQVQNVGISATNVMSWGMLKIMMVEEYCPKSVRQHSKEEFESLTMKGSELEAYTNRFNYLATLCPETVYSEQDKIEFYNRGLTPQVQTALRNCRPTTFEGVKRLATIYTNMGILQGTIAQEGNPPRGGNNKRKWQGCNKHESNSHRTTPNKRAVTVTPVTTTDTLPAPPRPYQGTFPECNECSYHHLGACRTLCCKNCQKEGHTAHFCRKPAQKAKQVTKAKAGRFCYGCGGAGHFKRCCPKSKGSNGESSKTIQGPTKITGTRAVINFSIQTCPFIFIQKGIPIVMTSTIC